MKIEGLDFNGSNIGVLRDIGIVLDFKMMANVDRDYRWCVKNNHIYIECKHHKNKDYKKIIIEFCGHGLIITRAIDHSDNWLESKLFSIDRYGSEALPAFRNFIRNEYQYYLM